MSSFINVMQSAGLQPPPQIIPGQLHRFPGFNKGQSNKSAWCLLFADEQAGQYGDWSTGLSETWFAHSGRELSFAEKQVYRLQREQTQEKYRQELKQAQDNAARKAVSIWNQSAPCINHAYLTKKAIQPHGARLDKYGNLIVPVFVDGEICSLQFIDSDGSKKFLSGGRVKGGYFQIGDLTKPDIQIYICEGFATGSSLYEHTGHPVYISFNAKNLILVAKYVKSQFSDDQIIIAADNDSHTAGNPGLTEGRKAAVCIGAELIYPDFNNEPFSGTDFNDYLIGGGVL